MNKKAIITLIAIVLVIFVLVKVSASYLCAPNPNNAVVSAVSAVSEAISSPQPVQNKKPDPFSWEPVMRRLLGFFSKACNN